MPERDIESLGVMGKGAGGGQEILPPPPPPSSPSSPTESGCLRVPNPLFSDTCERSRRATAGKLLAISLRFFLGFKKIGDFSKKQLLNTLQKISAVSGKKFFLIAQICIFHTLKYDTTF